MPIDQPRWYLVRTRQYKEKCVNEALSKLLPDTFLPFLRTSRRIRGQIVSRTVPLFSCYLFASFELQSQYCTIQRTPGVVGVLSAAGEPLEVHENIVEEIRRRGRNGTVELSQTLRAGDSVEVTDGPLRGVSGIFERYLSGPERVSLLVTLIGAANVRVIAPSVIVVPTRGTARNMAVGE